MTLPLKFMAGNAASPVITPQVGSWYEVSAYDLNVMVNPLNSAQMLIYATGQEPPAPLGVQQIGLFTANVSDLTSWTDQGVLFSKGSGWESTADGGVRVGTIFYDSGTFYLFYNADTYTPSYAASIGLATSSDGRTFTRYSGNPILTPTGQGRNDGFAVSQPAVIKEGSSWTMIYSYRNGGTLTGFRYATSSDGQTWTKGGSGDILTVAPRFGEFHAIVKSDKYYLIWEGGNNTTPWDIFIAESSVVTGPYINVRTLMTGSNVAGSFDQSNVAAPCLLNYNGTWLLFYAWTGIGITKLIQRDVSTREKK